MRHHTPAFVYALDALQKKGEVKHPAIPNELNEKVPAVALDLISKVVKDETRGQQAEQVIQQFHSYIRKSSMFARTVLKYALTACPVDPKEEDMALIDKILQVENQQDKLTRWQDIKPAFQCGGATVCTWRGDITTLVCDAVVNAANSQMLGCFTPGHLCIDNVIHAKAGPRLRAECRSVMHGSQAPTGDAVITKGYNLPAKHVLHTVGPIARYQGDEQPKLLASCYTQCLEVAKSSGVRSVAFCCISTGIFGYPNQAAAVVACKTVREWLEANPDSMDCVIFNTFLEKDAAIYEKLVPQVFN